MKANVSDVLDFLRIRVYEGICASRKILRSQRRLVRVLHRNVEIDETFLAAVSAIEHANPVYSSRALEIDLPPRVQVVIRVNDRAQGAAGNAVRFTVDGCGRGCTTPFSILRALACRLV